MQFRAFSDHRGAHATPQNHAAGGAWTGQCDTVPLTECAQKPPVICFPFAGGIMGGSHISALKLIRSLDPRQYHPLIVLHNGDGQFGDFLRGEGVGFELAPTERHIAPAPAGQRLRGLIGVPQMVASLTRFLRERNIRIVHTNEGPMHVTWGPPARLAGASLIWHHRSSPHAKGLRYVAPWLANRVVSVSRFAAPRPGLMSAAGKCTVVHSPFDTGRCKADLAASRARVLAELNLRPDTRILGYFGNFVGRKRPVVFVDAIAALRRNMPDVPVAGLMLGSPLEPGLDEAVRARAAEAGLSDRIHILGFRYPPEPWMAACDALIVTAVDEPFGRTLIEAMLLGTPVVAAASGGNVEAIRHGETGLLVRPDDADAFAVAIKDILTNGPKAATIAETACREAMTTFGIERHSRSITEIYRQLLAQAA